MARLNKWQKTAIVRAILDDTPKVDYKSQIEAIARAAFLELCPPRISDILKNGTEDEKRWVKTKYAEVPGLGTYKNSTTGSMWTYGGGYKYESLSVEKKAEIQALADLHHAQLKALDKLEDKLTSAFDGIRSRAQAMKLYPEFVRYYPQVEEQCRTLPSVVDVVTTLVEAGWPKKGTAEEKAQENSSGE